MFKKVNLICVISLGMVSLSALNIKSVRLKQKKIVILKRLQTMMLKLHYMVYQLIKIYGMQDGKITMKV